MWRIKEGRVIVIAVAIRKREVQGLTKKREEGMTKIKMVFEY